MVIAWYALLGLLLLERGFELRLSAQNARTAIGRGGVEFGRAHWPWLVALHVGFFVGCLVEPEWQGLRVEPAVAGPAVVALLAAQGLRYWAVSALGPRWNTRVIVVPGEPAIASGPYRWVRHPNYLSVVIEGLAVPLIAGAWRTALAFSVANAIVLRVRIRCEERALREHCGYDARLAGRGALLPRTLAR